MKKPPQTTKNSRGMSIGVKQPAMSFRGAVNLKSVGIGS